MIRTENYTVQIKFPIDVVAPLLSPDIFLKVDFQTKAENAVIITSKLEICFEKPTPEILTQYSNTKSVLLLCWNFDALFSDNISNDLSKATFIQESKRIGVLLLPSASCDTQSPILIDPVHAGWRLIEDTILRLSVRARSPQLYQACRDSVRQNRPRAKISIAGQELDVKMSGFNSKLDVIEKYITQAEASSVAAKPSKFYELHAAIADERLLGGDLRGAITNLNTAMEVAAYHLYNYKNYNEGKYDFSPNKFFILRPLNKQGKVQYQPGTLIKHINLNGPLNQVFYSDLQELYETRNEIVHNGQLRRRVNDDVLDPPKHNDYCRYRTALSNALVWMNFDPIE